MDNRKEIYDHIDRYTKPSWLLSVSHLTVSLVIWYYLMNNLSIFIVPLLSLMTVRIFIIFHDMGHNSFFPSKNLNYYVGTIIGIITMTPYSHWVVGHQHHHNNSNKLDRNQYSQTAAWTVKKYKDSNLLKKYVYKFIFGKYTLYTIVPWLYFVVYQLVNAMWIERFMSLAYVLALYCKYTTYEHFLLMLTYWLAGIIGFLIFHLQHTFDGVYKENSDKWDYFKNGIEGSSFLQVPWFLKFFTMGIEYHHIHHLKMLVPSYNLEECHNNNPKLFKNVRVIYFSDVLRTLHYSLYDETMKCFRDVYLY